MSGVRFLMLIMLLKEKHCEIPIREIVCPQPIYVFNSNSAAQRQHFGNKAKQLL
jgi:hypothetical protein